MEEKSNIIAVTGKGGTGKTVVSALIIRTLSGYSSGKKLVDGRILAIDADPATSLPTALGVKVRKTLGDVREEIASPSAIVFDENLPMDTLIDYKIKDIMINTPYFSLLAMGRSEGPGCYCLVNDMLRHFIDKLSRRFSIVIVDCEAGLEHLSRRTVRNVDTMFIVSDPTRRGIETAETIRNIAEKLEIKFNNIYLILNKISEGENEGLEKRIRESGLELIGKIPEDEKVKEYDLIGRPIIELPDDSKAVTSVEKIVNEILV